MPEVIPTILEYCRNNCKFYLTEGFCVYDELILGTLTFPLKCKGYLKYADMIKSPELERGTLPRDQQSKKISSTSDTIEMRPNAPQEPQPAVSTCGSENNKQKIDNTKPAVSTCGSDLKPAVQQVKGRYAAENKPKTITELDYQIMVGIIKGWYETKIGKVLKKHHSTIQEHIKKLTEGGYIVKPTCTHPGAKRTYYLTEKAVLFLENVTASRSTSDEKHGLRYTEERLTDSDISDPKIKLSDDENPVLTHPFDGKHHCDFRAEIIVNTYTKDGNKIKNWNNWEQYGHRDKDGAWDIRVNLSNDPHIIIKPHFKTTGSVKERREQYQKYAKLLLADWLVQYPGMITSPPILNTETTHNEFNDFIGSHLGKKFPPGEYRSPQFRRDNTPTPNKVEAIGEQLAENIEWTASVKLPEFAEKVVNILGASIEAIEGLRQEMGTYIKQKPPKRSHKKQTQKHESTIYG